MPFTRPGRKLRPARSHQCHKKLYNHGRQSASSYVCSCSQQIERRSVQRTGSTSGRHAAWMWRC